LCQACITGRYPTPWGQKLYEIAVENPQGVSRGVAAASLDGKALPEGAARVPLADDGAVHKVRVVLGRSVEEG